MTLSAATAQALAVARLAEAKLLLDRGHFSGSYYLAGYAVELALKVIVANQFEAAVIPDKQFVINTYSHDLSKLLGLAGLQATSAPADTQANWLIATQWSEASRYAIIDRSQALELVTAIEDDKTGVFQWLKSHW